MKNFLILSFKNGDIGQEDSRRTRRTEKDASEEGKTVEIPEASPSNELPKDVFEEGTGEEKKNNNIWLWIVIAIVVIIFLCFCGFIGSIVFLLWG